MIGLACLIIGETIFGRRSVGRNVAAAVAGSIVYRFLYAVILKTSIVPIECLKLVTAVGGCARDCLSDAESLG